MADLLVPDWPAPSRVRSVQTLRGGGCSLAPWDSFNLGDHVGDDPGDVAANRATLCACLPAEPLWLEQVHGITVVDAGENPIIKEADAAFTRDPETVCAVMTADCLPVLFCDRAGTVVAAAHAGWRGLASGVLEATVARMKVPAGDLLVWLGPAIGPMSFEVGDEVRAIFVGSAPSAVFAFKPQSPGKWLADIYQLARQRLEAIGVVSIFGGDRCTLRETEHFFSFRRDGVTGRMATLIWIDPEHSV
jgi:YfiH family protein